MCIRDRAYTVQIIPTTQLSSKLMTNLNLAAQDVETAYNNVLKRINASAGARVISSNLNRQDAAQISGTIQFEIKTPDADAVLNDIRGQGLVPVSYTHLRAHETPEHLV